jgi:hypothetical protein
MNHKLDEDQLNEIAPRRFRRLARWDIICLICVALVLVGLAVSRWREPGLTPSQPAVQDNGASRLPYKGG